MIKRGNNMIKINNLSHSFPQKDLYNNISFTLEEDQHCAFIGSSGSGKSTLIDIIMNPDNYMFDGDLEIAPNCKIGYVSQFSKLDNAEKTTVFEYLCGDYTKLQDEITCLCAEMETASDIEALLEKYQEALDTLDATFGDDFESDLNKKLNLANLNNLKDSMISELSGGEFKLIQVIKEMLNKPNLMIMDEPDVFLDFENLNALRNLINSYKGIMLVITHNRFLLNHCFNKIIHLENYELQEFDGSYIEYNFFLLQSKIELQELSIADDEEIERNERIIKRLRDRAEVTGETAAGRYLKARMKFQERLEARRIKMPFVEIKQPYIRLATANKIEEKIALKVSNYSASFDDVLLENVNFEINSNDKVAIIGLNGTGKTTLLKDIFKNNHPAIEIDPDIEVAYLSQLQGEILNDSNTILEEFLEAGFETYDEAKSYLSNYDFDEELVDQKIESLSGGEKNILQLAKISASHANMLLLDEPTSHLDTYSQMALEKAIERYNGAILMVSHDYYSIINCVDYVLLIEDKTIRKMKIKKFKKMIYDKYFDKNYLEIEQKKKAVEMNIAVALRNTDFERARELSEELEVLIKQL
jgi:ATP-binding cassette subfamily F protein 3